MPAATAPAKPADAPIYGYDYESRHYCSGCIEGALFNNTYSELHSAEQALDLIAADNGIDRASEGSYSYFTFPKILRGNLGMRCADCGTPLNKDLREPSETRLCAADHAKGEDCRLGPDSPEGGFTIASGLSS